MTFIRMAMTNSLAYRAHSKVKKKKKCCQYGQGKKGSQGRKASQGRKGRNCRKGRKGRKDRKGRKG